MSETILPVTVGIDGSEPSNRALDWAADEAARRGSPLHIVHAMVGWPYNWPFDIPRYPIEHEDPYVKKAQGVLADAEKQVAERHPDLRVTSELVQKSAAFALREQSAASSEVVVGHRGLGGFTSQLLGSTGLQVAGYAEGPVVIVRGEDTTARDEITMGVDLYNDCTTMLEYAFDEASLRGATLRAVHAFELAEHLVAAGDIDEAQQMQASQQRRLAEILAPYKERFPTVKVGELIVRDHPVAALTAASRESDLVIVGAPGHGPLPGALLGSVSHGTIHHAHCPVVVVRPSS